MDANFTNDNLQSLGMTLASKPELKELEVEFSESSSLTDGGFIGFLD